MKQKRIKQILNSKEGIQKKILRLVLLALELLPDKKISKKVEPEIDETIKEKKNSYSNEIKSISDFYAVLYRKKFKLIEQDKIPWNVFSYRSALKKLLNQGFSRLFLKACIYPYLKLDDYWLEKRGHPLENLGQYIHQCRQDLEKDYQYYPDISKDQYYVNYINDFVKKYGFPEEYREKNPEPPSGNESGIQTP